MGTALVTVEEVAKLVPTVVAQANQITIETNEDNEFACSFLTLVATRRKQVGETFDPIVEKAHEAHKEACAQRKKFLDPLDEAEKNVKGKVATWLTEQERLRKVKEEQETAAAKKQQDDAAIAEAAALHASGDTELADLVLENAATAPAPVVVVPSSVTKQAGIAKKTNWKWRYRGNPSDALRALVKAAAADERWLAYLCVNETVVGSEARAKKQLTKIPGIEVYPEDSVSVRSR